MHDLSEAYGPRVTKDLTFKNAMNTDPKIVYGSQVKNWIFSPAEVLANSGKMDTDHGMALLTVLLTFFEPHGAYLLGLDGMKTRDGELETTGHHVRTGFGGFLEWRSSKLKYQAAPEPASVYKWMRCGLFHVSHLPSSILVGIGPTHQSFFKNRGFDGWLVSPWAMLSELRMYFTNYMERLERKEQPLLKNFEKAYEFFFTKPIQEIQAKMPTVQ